MYAFTFINKYINTCLHMYIYNDNNKKPQQYYDNNSDTVTE